MSFVAAPPPTTSPATPVAQTVEHDGWFPAVNLSDLRAALRLGTDVTDARLVAAIEGAMLTIGASLADWKAARVAEGALALDAVDSDQINGVSRILRAYQRAVRAFASADLAETHSDISATEAGRARTDDRGITADEHRRNGIHAIRDMLGKRRTKVSLI